MRGLDRLSRHLDQLECKRVMWWRDDDAGPVDELTGQFAELVEQWALPLAMAVIPSQLCDQTTTAIKNVPGIAVLQHGWSHDDHSEEGQKKIELGGTIDRPQLKSRLQDGHDLLQAQFDGQYCPILVPPWNRIADDVRDGLSGGPHRGLSTFGPRGLSPSSRLYQISTHVDTVDWRADRAHKPVDRLADEFIDALSLDEPIGILTHHRIMDAPSIGILSDFLSCLASHPNLLMADIRDLEDLRR